MAAYDDDAGLWAVETDGGERVTARFLLTAVGCLSTANLPAFPGIERFQGEVIHTGQWPEGEVDFTGRRVVVIGTGSSGVQVIPKVAEQAEHLYVFQRTAHYIVPANNHPLTDEYVRDAKARYPEYRAQARASFWAFSTSSATSRRWRRRRRSARPSTNGAGTPAGRCCSAPTPT